MTVHNFPSTFSGTYSLQLRTVIARIMLNF